MIQEHPYKHVTWINVSRPTHDEVEHLMHVYGFAERVADEMLSPSAHARVDAYQDYVYVVLHFPQLRENHRGLARVREYEIDCIIGPDFLITSHFHDEHDVLFAFEKYLETAHLMDREISNPDGGFLFYELMALFYEHIASYQHSISQELALIEEDIFKGKEDKMVKKLALANRRLLDMKRSLRSHAMTLRDLREYASNTLGKGFKKFMTLLIKNHNEIEHLQRDNKEILDDLRTTNDLLLNSKTNHIMKILTIVSFVTIPVIIGMEILKGEIEAIKHTPISIGIVLFLTLLVSLSLWRFFKRKRWV